MEKQLGLKKELRPAPTLDFEKSAAKFGYVNIAGVDEAGRGPLAGPVVIAAVILGKYWKSKYLLNDSKKLSLRKRENLFDIICNEAKAFNIVSISPKEIDKLNILRATLFGMGKCLSEMTPKPDYAIIDGNHYPQIEVPGETVIKGDERSKSIAAASILAKVTRDRFMIEKAKLYPEWGFEVHKGYATKMHRKAIAEFGLTPMHRKSFKLKVKQLDLF